ncbi:membrane protein (plasmid) [Borreliella bissettiae]|uniref:Membrane protein n=1 Tax=Borrelia bissettiae TaxID=64897 RepID=A0A1L8ZA99_BORBI|nr:hypothetical protein [Borreliella bissettiae]OJH14676.1 membrane protein [Borreliella bissettiae]
MNGKMRMLIICAVFVLIISCKNYASDKDKDVKSLEQSEQDLKGKVEGFLDAKKEEFFGYFEKPEAEVQPKAEELVQADEPQGQAGVVVADVGVVEDSDLKEINKKLEELKNKINGTNDKTPIETYCEYEKEIEDLRETPKYKEKFKNQLEIFEKTLKDKVEKREKELEKSKEKLENLKKQVDTTSGITQGDQAQEQGKLGVQAWQCAQKLGLNENYSTNNGSDTGNLAKEIIENALKKIDEELKKLKNKKE